MLAHLKIIWQFHAHPVHQKVSRFLWAEIYWGRLFFRAESSLIQSSLVPVTPRIFLFDIKQKKSEGSRVPDYIQSSCRSFIGVIVPYEISNVNFHVETKIFVSMSEEI
jgi:hypothetical protein